MMIRNQIKETEAYRSFVLTWERNFEKKKEKAIVVWKTVTCF